MESGIELAITRLWPGYNPGLGQSHNLAITHGPWRLWLGYGAGYNPATKRGYGPVGVFVVKWRP